MPSSIMRNAIHPYVKTPAFSAASASAQLFAWVCFGLKNLPLGGRVERVTGLSRDNPTDLRGHQRLAVRDIPCGVGRWSCSALTGFNVTGNRAATAGALPAAAGRLARVVCRRALDDDPRPAADETLQPSAAPRTLLQRRVGNSLPGRRSVAAL